MKVIYLGYCKTGTTSIATALRLLGYKVYNYEENAMYLSEEWTKVLEGDKITSKKLKKMYEGVDATLDTPIFIFWREFLKAFPDIKFIFCQRDVKPWIKSWNNSNYFYKNNFVHNFLLAVTPTGMKYAKYARLLSREVYEGKNFFLPWKIWSEVTGEMALHLYQKHNKDVLENVPQSQVLVMKISEGWKPLCEFLDLPVPDAEFPHKNKNGGNVAEYVNKHDLFKKMKNELRIIFLILGSIVLMLFAISFNLE